MLELLDAINRLDQALTEAAARDAALAIGEAIGGSVGYPLKKTPEEINAMSWPEMQQWAVQVQENPPELP